MAPTLWCQNGFSYLGIYCETRTRARSYGPYYLTRHWAIGAIRWWWHGSHMSGRCRWRNMHACGKSSNHPRCIRRCRGGFRNITRACSFGSDFFYNKVYL